MALIISHADALPLNERSERRLSKVARLKVICQAAILAIAFTATGRAEGAGGVTKQEVQAKLTYCEICHGVSAQGFHGYFPIPRLAGQQPEYLKNQLQAFIERRRINTIMFNVGHVLSPAMIAGLTASLNELNPKPLGGAPKEIVDTGRKIFQDGIADASVPPCATCHGPEAKGNGQFPRLAGQLYDYIFNKLTNWDKERGQDPNKPDLSKVMEPITHGLRPQQIKAVAAYLSYLE
jgi:cytochrome c553